MPLQKMPSDILSHATTTRGKSTSPITVSELIRTDSVASRFADGIADPTDPALDRRVIRRFLGLGVLAVLIDRFLPELF